MGIPEAEIKSPTFALMNEYPDIIHYDLYRLEQADTLLLEQIQEQLESGKHLLIEWPERLGYALTGEQLLLQFEHIGEKERRITIQ